jgi:hypothetical protein
MSKGGETTQKTEIDPEFKRRILATFDKADALSKLAPIPYQGLTMAAPSDATKQSYKNVNNAASLLGVGMEGDILAGLPEEKEMGGMKGYSAFDGYQQELSRMYKNYPQLMQQYQNFMPGLLQPGKEMAQANPDMFPGYKPQGNGQGYPNNYQNIYNTYHSRGRVGR